MEDQTIKNGLGKLWIKLKLNTLLIMINGVWLEMIKDG
jgi:hypothetical protein